MRRLVSTVLWYIGWIFCVKSASHGDYWSGSLMVFFILVIHLATTKSKFVDTTLILLLGIVGTFIDTIYLQIGMIHYNALYADWPGIAPLWITSLWALYAISIHSTTAWLRGNIPLEILFGACGGPFSYFVAVRMGAASFGYPAWIALFLLSIVWAFVIPVCFRISDQIEDILGQMPK